ncbi:MAG TPA: cysteine--tRNA ligase, partial [Oribacterium sp.]|nr:cysteine--tRNA ligase [Oribacterium sp.]
QGYKVTYVSNYTDVDDKIIKESIEEGVSCGEITKKYIAEVEKDMADMNIEPASAHPKATEEIQGMIDLIKTLIENGNAYVAADGTVYFDTTSFRGYGKLSHKNIDELQSGFRDLKVSGEEGKRTSTDFVLWKPKKEGEPYWESPWCEGRPGWHTECCVMAPKYCGGRLDIHAGGEDLVFPHHENEIAQYESAHHETLANYWMHNAFININNQKMSKSLGNFFTVRDITAKYDPMVLRFYMLSAHYRNPLNFSKELMDSAKTSLDRIYTALERLHELSAKAQGDSMTAKELEDQKSVDALQATFNSKMDDDLNTADAITAIFELVRLANVSVTESSTKAYVDYVLQKLELLMSVLGLRTELKKDDLDSEVEKLIEERQAARKAKDFAKADEIRDQLLAMGIILKDTREGVKWSRA